MNDFNRQYEEYLNISNHDVINLLTYCIMNIEERSKNSFTV